MSKNHDLCFSLITWLQTFNLKSPHATVEEISDGSAIAEALTQIAPEWFDGSFISKIRSDVGANWRLKISNLKKIVDSILDYYQECLNQQLISFAKPDVGKIAEHCDRMELGRLLQLLLGCAVNCIQKQAYITVIMGMEESVQRVIMQAIQELENGSQTSLNVSDDFHLHRLATDLDRVTEERDQMAQKCHDLDIQIKLLQDEKTGLQQEVSRIQEKLQETENPVTASASVSSSKYGLVRRELDAMKEELFKAECARDDARARLEAQDAIIVELQTRVDDLHALADEARILKDEIDVLRETADKAGKFEATIESYKRKLEELSDLKRQCKHLEDKNAGYMQINMDLEEELKRQGAWKSQAEAYKKQISELVFKQKEDANTAEKLSVENRKWQEKLEAVLREKERLLVERNSLKEANEELSCQLTAAVTVSTTCPGEVGERSDDQRQTGAEQALLDAANNQIFTLTQNVRLANKRILELEALQKSVPQSSTNGSHSREQMGKATISGHDVVAPEVNPDQQEEFEHLHRKNMQLKEALARKETELAASEEKFKKCMEKAKAVISSLEPKQQSDALRHRIEKIRIQSLDEDQPLINELKLMTSAFHHLSNQKQRESGDNRLANLSTGQSFLARQRAPVARKMPNK